jgi:glycosyltransferase involved in cell wall biosynthesis
MNNFKSPLISIITPTYNHEKYIESCIKSVLAQTFSNWEMIIIDDESTDSNLQIIKSLASFDSRIKVISQKHVGIYRLDETYNRALEYSKGDYIAILEGDDLWEPSKLDLQISTFNNNPECILVWGRASSLIGTTQKLFETHPKCETTNFQYYFNNPITSFFNIVFDDFPPPLTFLIKKEALLKIGGFKQTLPFPAVDLPTILELSKLGPFTFLPIQLGFWRQHAYQITKSNSIQIVEGSAKIILNHFHSLSQNERAGLKFDLSYINKNTKERKVISYARSGRFKLIKKEFQEARKDYIRAILKERPTIAPVWKLRAFIGLVFSFFHMDVEGLSKLLGKVSYK